ncbi:MAG: acyl-CoA dehydrogenase family protein [Verrucomicrobia bacterium]|nr:acyl-CoA dehydrogenase family protein [Verrucomicrobiota bacterium]
MTNPAFDVARRWQLPPIERGKSSFDCAQLRKVLDGDQREVREKVMEIIAQFERFQGTNIEDYRAKVLQWTEQAAAKGIGRTFMLRSLGGEEDLPKFIAAFETFAYFDINLLVKLGVQFGLFAGSIQRLGTAPHHQKYLVNAVEAKLLGCFAMTEIGHGSNVQGIQTEAVYEPESDCFVINSPTYDSGKNYIGGAARDARLATVFAQLKVADKQYGVHAFLVPIRDEKGNACFGVTLQDNGLKMGLNGVDNGRIWFRSVRIPRTEMLDRFGRVSPGGEYNSPITSQNARFFAMIGTLVSGRISVAAAANCVAKSALTIAVRYAARRRQFGSPNREVLLLDYPAHQRRLIPFLANVYASHFAIAALVQENENDPNSKAVETSAAAIKIFSTQNCTFTIQECREACGGEGYIAANRFSALRADSEIFTTFEGDNTVLLQLVAKNLLSALKDKLQDMPPAGRAQFFLQQKLAEMLRKHPAYTFNLTYDHLVQTRYQLALIRIRETANLSRCARKLRSLLKSGKLEPFAAFVHLQLELMELARAHTSRLILERFASSLEKVGEPSLKRILKRLCDLYALHEIERNRGWFLENGLISAIKSRAVSHAVDRLCRDLRADVVHLVDAFGIPDGVLAAPIAV